MLELLDVCAAFYYLHAVSNDFNALRYFRSSFYDEELHRPFEVFRRQIKYIDHNWVVPLEVKRVYYGSPGEWALVGLLTAVKPLYDVLVGVRDRSIDTKLKKAMLKKFEDEEAKTMLEVNILKHEIEQQQQKERFELFQRLHVQGMYADLAFAGFYPEIDEKLVILFNLAEQGKFVDVRIEEHEE